MRWFHNLKISAKLIASFSAVIVLAVGIGGLAVYELAVMNERLVIVNEDDIPSLVYIGTIDGRTADIRMREFRYVLTRDAATKSSIMREIEQYRAEIDATFASYDPLISDTERKLVDDYLGRREQYRSVQNRVFQLADAGRYEEAVDLLVGESLQAYRQLATGVEKVTEYNVNSAAAGAEEAAATYRSARAIIFTALFFSVLFGIGIALYVARLIARPVTRLAEASRALALGDVNVNVEVDSRDEVGELARSFAEMAEAQKQMAGAATAVAAGDVSVEIRPRSDRDVLGLAFVELRRVVQALLRDTGELIASAKDGQLARRADAQSYKGGYAELLRGINELLDAVTTPIDEASNTLERLAARDLGARMNGEYRGDFAKIKAAVNTAASNLDEALSEVSMASEQVAGASDQISAGSQVLAEGASEQASALEEVSSSLQEMASMSRQNAANAREAKTLADAARNGATRGVESMRRLSGAVSQIKESSDATARIVKTIDEIAFQTNLLALNAAVEAARAGDAGKGFAVVAEEVRNLAMRSAEAAKNTAALIEEAVRNADSGVDINAEVLARLEEIDAGVNKVGEVMAEITAASEQQTQGVDQISAAVEQMNGVTQQTAANSEESASAAEELSGQAERMRELVGAFTLTRVSATPAKVAVRRAPAKPAKRASAASPAVRKKNGNGNGNGHTPRFDPAAVIPFGDDEDIDTLAEF